MDVAVISIIFFFELTFLKWKTVKVKQLGFLPTLPVHRVAWLGLDSASQARVHTLVLLWTYHPCTKLTFKACII